MPGEQTIHAAKIRKLVADLERAGFTNRGGKGGHRNFIHPAGARVTKCCNQVKFIKIELEQLTLNSNHISNIAEGFVVSYNISTEQDINNILRNSKSVLLTIDNLMINSALLKIADSDPSE